MKQGSATRDGRYGGKVEPIAKAVSPGAVSQIGSAMGNHVMDSSQVLRGVSKELYKGKGYMAPAPVKCVAHKSGSQGEN